MASPRIGPAARASLAVLLVLAGYAAAARAGDVFPFDEGGAGVTPEAALTALPPDFPVPSQGALEFAGEGEQLPYEIVWTTPAPVVQMAATYRSMIASGRWELMLAEEEQPAYRVRVARIGDWGDMTHWAMLNITPLEAGSRISLEFMVTGDSIELR